MKVLVCGGRNFNDKDLLFKTLYKELCPEPTGTEPNETWLPPRDLMIIAGGARGAGSLAIDWCMVNFVQFKEFPADWAKHGRAAGPIRNLHMLNEGDPDLVIAFPGGRGTAHMVELAKKAGVKVIEVAG